MAQLLSSANVTLVQNYVGHFLAGDVDGYLAGCHHNLRGAVLGGLVPTGENLRSRDDLEKLIKEEMPKFMEIRKFEPSNWVGVGDQARRRRRQDFRGNTFFLFRNTLRNSRRRP